MRPISPGHLPFPPLLAEMSAQSARRDSETRRARGNVSYREVPHLAAYQLADGTIRPAYDLFDPSYPEGASPGLATLRFSNRQFPNETQGYEITAIDFRPASEYLRDFPIDAPGERANPWDSLAAAYYTDAAGRSGFILAHDEDEMRAWVEAAPQGVSILRHNVTRCGVMDLHQGATEIFMALGEGGGNLFVAATKEDLADALRTRFSFIDLPENDQDAIEKVTGFAHSAGWTVASRELATGDLPLHRSGCSCSGCIISAQNHTAAKLWGDYPPRALMRPVIKVQMAQISTRFGDAIVHAETPRELTRHIARAACDLYGVGPEALGEPRSLSGRHVGHPQRAFMDHEFAQYVIAKLWELNPELTVDACEGEAHLAYGAEPSHLAMVKVGVEGKVLPDVFGLAGSTEETLKRALKERFGEELGLVAPFNGDDVLDALWAHEDYEATFFSREEMIDLMHAKNKDPAEILEP